MSILIQGAGDHRRAPRAVRAVIMAGGRSERMRATLGPRHKALVEVAGVPLIERNIVGLCVAGFTDIVVVTSDAEPAIGDYLAGRGASVARRFDAQLSTFVEREPLGNIGVVRELCTVDEDLLVVYVDNLTSIPVDAMVARHRAAGAALTIAAHVWPLRNPFGELDIADGYIRSYREKPVRDVSISSGSCVVGSSAARLIPAGRPCGSAELCQAALAAGLPVAAYEHAELWVDVNDAQALAQAELLLCENPERFSA